MPDNRGTFRNREYAQQLKIFEGLRFGKITPTDIDAFLDFNDKVFIWIEVKHGVSSLPFGQRLALERLCNACTFAGKRSFVLVAHHQSNDDIDVASLPVTSYYYRGKWYQPKQDKDVRNAIETILHGSAEVNV